MDRTVRQESINNGNRLETIAEEIKVILVKKNLCIGEAYAVLQCTKMKIEESKLS